MLIESDEDTEDGSTKKIGTVRVCMIFQPLCFDFVLQEVPQLPVHVDSSLEVPTSKDESSAVGVEGQEFENFDRLTLCVNVSSYEEFAAFNFLGEALSCFVMGDVDLQ